MKHMRRLAIGLAAALACAIAQAQGIPVIDSANLTQTIQQVVNDITKINNQVQQITQLQNQLASINGMRNL
ncbi:MAG: type VI secretion protein, partial [Rubrivivax sp.]|nr:type VI secretion protein [Rubrivivax sp.]